jgi:hypothetical protein
MSRPDLLNPSHGVMNFGTFPLYHAVETDEERSSAVLKGLRYTNFEKLKKAGSFYSGSRANCERPLRAIRQRVVSAL